MRNSHTGDTGKRPISRKRLLFNIFLAVLLLSVSGYLIYLKFTDDPGERLKGFLYATYPPPFFLIGEKPAASPGPLAPRKVGELYGFEDEEGNMVIDPRYAFASDFTDGRASVAVDNNDYGYLVSNYRSDESRLVAWKNNFRAGIIDETGVFLWSYPSLDALPSYFSEGLARVCILGKYGFIDRQGNMVIEPGYDTAGTFSDGYAKVSVVAGEDKHTYMIDTSGSIVEELIPAGDVAGEGAP